MNILFTADDNYAVRIPVVLKSIQINNGAIIEGSCSQCYSDVTASNFFDEEE